jgi:hypothetical protein
MIYLLRSAMILLVFGVILGSLAYFQPGFLSQVRLNFWDAPGQLQRYNREIRRSGNLAEFKKGQDERRAEIQKIVEAVCKEEFGLCEAARRVKALETERHLPPLTWGEPQEKWPELLYRSLLDQVADELGNQPEKAKRLLPQLAREMQDKFGLPQIALPSPQILKEEKADNRGAFPIRVEKVRPVAD